jgi:hypothetical protein
MQPTKTDFATLLATAKPGLSFNEDMMRALLAGTKTQTRRPMKPQPNIPTEGSGWETIRKFEPVTHSDTVYAWAKRDARGGWVRAIEVNDYPYYKPRFQPGGVYYARETFLVNKERPCGFEYRADWCDELADEAKWFPAIHFPRRAARCIYRIDDVFPQRIQDLTSEQIIAEGVPSGLLSDWRDLIVRIYGAEYYDSDPWTFAHEFTLLAVREEGR